MALQVWLPLNKNEVKNQGYENPTITIAGTLTYADGKLGKCLTLQGSSSIYVKIPYTNIGTEMSVCCWVKADSPGNWSDIFSFGNNNRIEKTTTTQYYYFADSNPLITMGPLFTMNNAVWTHIAMTVDGTNVKFYINGTLFGTYSQINTLSTAFGNNKFFILGLRTTLSTPYKGYMNDFRIYNHALSPKEVKEISKGLILHYKLDGNDIGITIPRNGGLIPDGVELYDYILSSGTLWINTGVNGYMNHRYELDYQLTGTGSYRMWGVFGQSAWLGYNMSITYAGGRCVRWSSTSSGLDLIDNIDNTNNITRHTIIINKGLIYYDGTDKGKSSGHSDSCVINYPIYLFTVNPANTTPTANAVARVYRYKDTDVSGNAVRNMLPCTYLGEPGMWDTVENKFYRNQGTGQFTLGNKITLKEYEYLEANKAPYIDTQFIPKGNTSVEMQLMALSSTQNNGFFGAYGSGWADNSYGFYGWSGEKIWNNYKNDVAVGTYTSIFPINTIHKVFKDKNTLYIDNRLIRQDAYTNFTAPYTLLIFDINKSNNRCPAKMRLYYTKIWDNNTLVRDFIPVSYNGTPGLWDKVEWKFYANAGSGSFTLGPEKTVQQDAPIFYDSSGYCNHGSITGTLTTNSDSPRYTQCISGNAKISTSKITVNNPFTISYWVYVPATNSTGSGTEMSIGPVNLYKDHDGIDKHTFSITKSDGNPHYATIIGPNGSGWYHIAVVSTGSQIILYRNTTKSTFSLVAKSGLATFNILLNNNLRASDVRVYCTALSEDDVKELYNTSAFVTNNGVFAEYELYEDNLSDVKKTGLLETANFYENGAESGYTLDTDKTRVASNYIISEDFIEI